MAAMPAPPAAAGLDPLGLFDAGVAQPGRRGKTGKIADHTSAQGDDQVVPGETGLVKGAI